MIATVEGKRYLVSMLGPGSDDRRVEILSRTEWHKSSTSQTNVLARAIAAYGRVAFASTGGCGWPKYDLSRRATMRFDITSKVVDDPRSAERTLWEGVR